MAIVRLLICNIPFLHTFLYVFFRDYIQNNMVERLKLMLRANYFNVNMRVAERNELQYQSIRIISLLIKFDDRWLATQQDLVEALKQIWGEDSYQVIYLFIYYQRLHHFYNNKSLTNTSLLS